MSTLGKFNYDYQVKMLSSLLNGGDYTLKMADLYEDDYIEDDSLKFLFGKYFEYYQKYKSIPTLDYFKSEISKENEHFQPQIITSLRKAWENKTSPDLEYIQDDSVEFCKNRALKKAILESVDLINAGKYEDVKRKVDSALNKGEVADIGYDYNADILARYAEQARVTVPTGWGVLDDLLQGGLSGGEIGVIIAPSGIGKTWMLSHIGCRALQAGKTVAHYSFELGDTYVGLRYDVILTGMVLTNLKNNIEKVQASVNKLTGKLRILEYPTRHFSTISLQASIDRLKRSGHNPDLIILDYADLMKIPGTFSRDDLALQGLYEELRGLSKYNDIPIWTASQTNRSGTQTDIVTANEIADSYGKIMTADFVMSVSRKEQDVLNNMGRLHVVKNRFGPDKLTFPMDFDTNRGLIEVNHRVESSGQISQEQEVAEKSYLRNLYKTINSDENSGDNLFS